MSIAIRCPRIYDKQSLKAIIQSCGGCPPEDPRCPPLDCLPCEKSSKMDNGSCNSNNNSSPKNCMTCPPQPPCPKIYSSCTGFACITGAQTPKSVPDSTGCVIRTPMISGGLFYIGTSRVPPPRPACTLKPCCPSGCSH